MDINRQIHLMKLDASKMAATSNEERNAALEAVVQALEANKQSIFEANAQDLHKAENSNIAPAVMKRLMFDEHKMRDVIAGIEQLIELPDPLGRKLLDRQLDEGLRLLRVSVPIGVIGVIFEARPDALVQISSLCIKSGNCAVLKGGRETAHTNRILFQTIYDAVTESGMPSKCLAQMEAHSEIDELLKCDKDVDLLIPRGSNAFVRYIMDHTKIPVMGHADGVCHIYVDSAADQEQALSVIVDAKTQYTAACNSVETVLVNRSISEDFLPRLVSTFQKNNVTVRGSAEVLDILNNSGKSYSNVDNEPMLDNDFHTEYLALTASVKLVDNVEEAADHINTYGSHHTDAIITADDLAGEYFMQHVDSAGVYRNCSTRFADGFRYGFGAEVGISTSKIHARGPVGLEGLVTYKYLMYGSGQIVEDYASGKSHFNFKDLI